MKRLFVPMTGEAGDRAVLDISLKAVPDAHVDAHLFRSDPKAVPFGFGDGISGDVIQMYFDTSEQRGQKLLAAARSTFETWCADNGVTETRETSPGKATASFGELIGSPTATLAAPARIADLLIFGRAQEGDSEQEILLSTALFEIGRPILLAPNGTPHVAPFRHITIAWNGSQEATRAVSMAMPILHGAENVNVVTVGDDDKESVDPSALAATLQMNGIKSEHLTVVQGQRAVSDLLWDEVDRTGSDLIVMGTYGHSRLREMIFGGTTREVLKGFPVPAFLAH